MALQKMKALHAHLDAAKLVGSNRLDSWMEDGKLVPSQQRRGGGLMICQFQYDAIFVLEAFHREPELLMAIVCAWLIEHDAERDDQQLSPPSIDVDMVDEKSADVEINITFREDIELAEDPAGAITLRGKTYSIASLSPDVASQVGVGDDPQQPTDAQWSAP